MLLNNKGSILIETLISLSIITILVSTIIPLSSLLHKEGQIIEQQRIQTTKLHDELQTILWSKSLELPLIYEADINSLNTTFSFKMEGEYVKGCAKWRNVKKKLETTCLFGYKQQ